MDYEYLSERIDGFIALIDLINSYKFIISSDEVKKSFFQVALLVCFADGEIHEKEKDLLNILFKKDYSVKDYENKKPSKSEEDDFLRLIPSLFVKYTSEYDIELKKILDTKETIATMYIDIVIELMKQCMLADGYVDSREESFVEAYEAHMKAYIEGI